MSYLAIVTSNEDPIHFKDDVLDPHWNNAMSTEVVALEENDTFEITELPPGKVALGCKWVYRMKFNSDGTANS